MSTTRRGFAALAAAAALSSTVLTSLPAAQAAPTPAPKPGNGWAVVTLAKAGPSATRPLYLVSPTGAQYRAGTVPANWWVADVSSDGGRVLIATADTSPTGGAKYRVIDTRTQRTTVVKGIWNNLRMGNPTGYRLIGRELAPKGREWLGTGSAVRTDLAGNVLTRFANTLGGTMETHSPDGRYLLSWVDETPVVNLNSNGLRTRELSLPKGTTSCYPGHWTSNTEFTAYCYGSAYRPQVYRMSITGKAPVALTNRLTTGERVMGYTDSWTTPAGQVLTTASDCQAVPLALARGTRVTTVKAALDHRPLTVVGSSVFLTESYVCADGPGVEAAGTLVRLDLVTNRTTELAGRNRNKGLVVHDVVMVDSTR